MILVLFSILATAVRAATTANLPRSFTGAQAEHSLAPRMTATASLALKNLRSSTMAGLYQVFTSTARQSDYNLVYFNLADFEQANSETLHCIN